MPHFWIKQIMEKNAQCFWERRKGYGSVIQGGPQGQGRHLHTKHQAWPSLRSYDSPSSQLGKGMLPLLFSYGISFTLQRRPKTQNPDLYCECNRWNKDYRVPGDYRKPLPLSACCSFSLHQALHCSCNPQRRYSVGGMFNISKTHRF